MSKMSNLKYEKDALLGKAGPGAAAAKPTTRWGQAKETDETRNLDSRGVLDLQKQKMADQDKLLDILGDSVDRQKEIALSIHTEVDEQIDLIDHLGDEVGKTTGRVRRATDKVANINLKSSTTWLWVTICILFLALLLVIFLAFYF